jgi:hypothetical protein
MDLQNHIDDLLDRLEVALEFTKWKRVDEFVWEYTGTQGFFTVVPDLLSYEENDKIVTKIWLMINERAFSDVMKQELFNCLKPFRDEDYRGSNYWINPDYPIGYWYNHTL